MARAVTFVASAGVLVLYALRGGAFDVVVRAELGIAAWWAVAIGWAIGVLPLARPTRAALLPLAGLALLAAWTALSLTWTESPERTGAELGRVAHHAGLLVLALSLLSPRTWRAAAGGLAAGALVVCALALADRLWPAVFPADVVARAFHSTRLSYPLNYWNAVGAWSAIALVVGLVWSAHAERQATRALALAAVPIAALAAYLTYSRAAVAGVAFGALVAWAASRHRGVLLAHMLAATAGSALAIAAARAHPEIATGRGGDGGAAVALALLAAAALGAGATALTWRLHGDARWRLPPLTARRLSIGAAVAALAAGALALPPELPRARAAFAKRAVTASTADPASRLANLGGNRSTVWGSALAAFRAHPGTGTGAGTFEFWWSRDARDAEFVADAHSLYLEPLAELGVPGLACVLALCAGGVLVCVRSRRRALSGPEAGAAAACLAGFAVWLLHAGVDWMWESTATVALAFGLLAAAAAARAGPARRVGLLPRAGVATLAVVAIAVQLPPLVGVSSLRASQRAVAAHDDRRAVAVAQDAVAALPWGASPNVQLALLAERRGDLATAEAEARQAISLEPTNWRHPLLLARLLAQRGDVRAALAAFEQARRLRPLARVFSSASAGGR